MCWVLLVGRLRGRYFLLNILWIWVSSLGRLVFG